MTLSPYISLEIRFVRVASIILTQYAYLNLHEWHILRHHAYQGRQGDVKKERRHQLTK